jgi:hypothetical protein
VDRTFSLSFVDDEGDTCYMGSDTEMKEAIRFANKPGGTRTLKLIVTVTTPKEPAPTPTPVVATSTVATTLPDTPNTTSGPEPLVVPSVGNITPVFPEIKSKLHPHQLVFAFGLSGRHCDGCSARPIATAYQCKRCNYGMHLTSDDVLCSLFPTLF